MTESSVLIIDNDTKSVELLKKLLPIFGHSPVYIAHDGLMGLELLSQKNPALILVDNQIAKLESLLLSEIVHFVPRFRETSMVLIGRFFDNSSVEEHIMSGVYAFLEKPITADNVKKILGSIKTPSHGLSNLSKENKLVLNEVSKTVKAMLSLIFGQPARIVRIEEVPVEIRKKKFEIAGVVKAEGNTTIEIALGTSLATAKQMALWQGKSGHKNHSIYGRAKGEFLSAVLDRTYKTINDIYPVRRTPSYISFDSPLSINPNADQSYVVYYNVALERAVLLKQLTFALVITITKKS